jgi:hypothetical protein
MGHETREEQHSYQNWDLLPFSEKLNYGLFPLISSILGDFEFN